MEERRAHTRKIACRQVLREDSSVYSIQGMSIPASRAGAVTPAYLLERYLDHVRRFTFSLVRPLPGPEGIDFRILATRASLLSFNPPRFGDEGSAGYATLMITGGLLARPGGCGLGELSFITEKTGDRVKVVVRLSGYFPVILGTGKPPHWRKLFYRLTQALLHKIVTIAFLTRLCRELEGKGKRIRVIKVKGVAGEEI